jgi:hypothetical protein
MVPCSISIGTSSNVIIDWTMKGILETLESLAGFENLSLQLVLVLVAQVAVMLSARRQGPRYGRAASVADPLSIDLMARYRPRNQSHHGCMIGDRELIRSWHTDRPEGAHHGRPGSLRAAFDHSSALPEKLARCAAAASSREAKWSQAAANRMLGQNANRCASFVSVGTRFLGLFRPK